MNNIEAQLCGLVLDIIILYFLSKHKRVGLYTETVFKNATIVYTLCIMLDILSVILIKNSERFNEHAIHFVCKDYLVFLMLCGYFAFVYTYSDVKRFRDNKIFGATVFGLMLLGTILILALPVRYYYDGVSVYSYGPSVRVTFVFAPIFIISTIIFTFVHGKQMNPHRRKAVRIWMLVEIGAAVIQFLIPEALLVGFGSALGLFVLYSELENPEANIDRGTGAFSHDTYDKYIKQLYESGRNFSCIGINSGTDWKIDNDLENRVIVEMAEFLNSFGDSKLFRTAEYVFTLVYDKKEKEVNEAESAINLDIIRERFKEPWAGGNFSVHTKYLYIPDGNVASSLDELDSLRYFYRDTFAENDDLIILDEESSKKIREIEIMNKEIKAALDEDRFEVYYQPIYSVASEHFVSAEALARMKDGDGNILMPGKFIPVAEETGLIEQIGERVFRKACQFIKSNSLSELGVKFIEVNLSVSQCENPSLSTVYREIMKEEEVSPDKINLEITESSRLNSRNILLENMNMLMTLGCKFALDDFGTGESNLNYIVDMPVNIVKFDRGMVQEYFTNEKARIVMQAAVEMIKKLGLRIVAEGVETEEQLEGIKALGIDYIQGYYFSKPLPAEEFLSFVKSRNKKFLELKEES